MTFDMREFTITNLINGYKNGSFRKEQINIFLVNYTLKGVLKQGDIRLVNDLIDEYDKEIKEE